MYITQNTFIGDGSGCFEKQIENEGAGEKMNEKGGKDKEIIA